MAASVRHFIPIVVTAEVLLKGGMRLIDIAFDGLGHIRGGRCGTRWLAGRDFRP